MSNTANDIGTILSGVGGSNGIGDDIANVINAIGGKSVPQNVTYVTAPDTSSNISPVILIGGGLMVILLLVLVLNRNG